MGIASMYGDGKLTTYLPQRIETDQIFTPEKRHRSEELLKEIGATYQINLYSGTEHGFAVRADLSKPQQRWAREQAFYQALTWFQEYLKE